MFKEITKHITIDDLKFGLKVGCIVALFLYILQLFSIEIPADWQMPLASFITMPLVRHRIRLKKKLLKKRIDE